jgi:hypothetical protein
MTVPAETEMGITASGLGARSAATGGARRARARSGSRRRSYSRAEPATPVNAAGRMRGVEAAVSPPLGRIPRILRPPEHSADEGRHLHAPPHGRSSRSGIRSPLGAGDTTAAPPRRKLARADDRRAWTRSGRRSPGRPRRPRPARRRPDRRRGRRRTPRRGPCPWCAGPRRPCPGTRRRCRRGRGDNRRGAFGDAVGGGGVALLDEVADIGPVARPRHGSAPSRRHRWHRAGRRPPGLRRGARRAAVGAARSAALTRGRRSDGGTAPSLPARRRRRGRLPSLRRDGRDDGAPARRGCAARPRR